MDPRRQDEERDREDRHADEERQPVGPARDDAAQTTTKANASSAAPRATAGMNPKSKPRARRPPATGFAMTVSQIHVPAFADPVAVELGEGPRVVGVDADVRVAGRGREDLLDQPGAQPVRSRSR